MSNQEVLTWDIYEKGMTSIHRLGLGALAATCTAMEHVGKLKKSEWEYTNRTVTLHAQNMEELLNRIAEFAFQFKNGMLYIPATYHLTEGITNIPNREYIRAKLHQGLRASALKSPKIWKKNRTGTGGKKPKPISITFMTEDNQPGKPLKYTPELGCKITNFSKDEESKTNDYSSWRLFRNGVMCDRVSLASTVLPGAKEIHPGYGGKTDIDMDSRLIILVRFAAAGYVSVICGKDSFLIYPEVDDIDYYIKYRHCITPRTVDECVVSGAIEVAARGYIKILDLFRRAFGTKSQHGMFHITRFSKVGWDTNLARRTGTRTYNFDAMNDEQIDDGKGTAPEDPGS